MKIECPHCSTKMDRVIEKQFTSYEVGFEICPKCKKENKRYISALDINIYSLGNVIVYGIGLALMSAFTVEYYSSTNPDLFVTIGLTVMVGLSLILFGVYWADYIYMKAPLKKPWMNMKFSEDGEYIKKRTKRTFNGSIALLLIFAVVTMYVNFIYYYVVLGTVFVLFALKTKKSYDLEKANYENKKR